MKLPRLLLLPPLLLRLPLLLHLLLPLPPAPKLLHLPRPLPSNWFSNGNKKTGLRAGFFSSSFCSQISGQNPEDKSEQPPGVGVPLRGKTYFS